jgi:hypothetical protein
MLVLYGVMLTSLSYYKCWYEGVPLSQFSVWLYKRAAEFLTMRAARVLHWGCDTVRECFLTNNMPSHAV